MIFIGDIAIPNGIEASIDWIPDSFNKSPVIANLEGLIVESDMVNTLQNKLFSDINVIQYLKRWNVKAVSLANNHITDVPEAFSNTINLLSNNNIAFFGAGKNKSCARECVKIDENGRTVVLLGYGWSVISCKKPCRGRVGVNLLTKKNVLSAVNAIRKENPDAYIVVMPHWDYELEKYPMPAHRELAMLAIDSGADAVIGHHPHCVQGIEIYRQKPIIYSLGNWFIPQDTYMGGRLIFPEYTELELAVELIDSKILLHWFRYSKEEHSLRYLNTENLEESELIKGITQFSGMTTEEYYYWFKQHRVKNKALPIYKSCSNNIANFFKDLWVNLRQHLLDFLFVAKVRERNCVNKQ